MNFNQTRPAFGANLREKIIAHVEQNPDIYKRDESSEEWLNNQIEIGNVYGFTYIETYEQLVNRYNIPKTEEIKQSA